MLVSTPPVIHQFAWFMSLAMLTISSIQAQTTAPNPTVNLKEVVISGSRAEQALDELPFSAVAITATDIEKEQMNDIRGVAKNLPNVAVKRAPARFSITGKPNPVGADGNAGFSIRGQSGNRVILLVDGIRLPRSYINGSNAFGRDFVSMGLLKRIEVVYGPTSVLYGSDGLAGLVNYITLEPADYLVNADGTPKSVGGKFWVGYSGDNDSKVAGATVAARASESAEWSLTGTSVRASGMSNMGTNNAANVDRTMLPPTEN